MPNVRKNELESLFENRAESLLCQDDLGQRWQELGNTGRKKLKEKLKQIAKETPVERQSIDDERDRYPYNGDPGESLISFLNHQAPYNGKYGYYSY